MVFLFARLAWTIGASGDEEALCLRDRAKDFVCKMDRRLGGGLRVVLAKELKPFERELSTNGPMDRILAISQT